MKKLPLALSALLLTPIAAQADLLGAGIGAGMWQATPSGTAALSGVTFFDADNNLKTSSNNYAWAYINHPIPLLPNAMIEQKAFSSEKSTDKLTLDQLDATLYWGLPIPMVDINFGLTFKQVSGEVVGGATSEKIDAIIPMGYLAVHLPIPATDITLSADMKTIGYDNSSISDSSVKVRWDLIGLGVKLGVEAGYRMQSLTIDGLGVDVKTDITIDGAFAGVTVVF